MNIRTLFSVFLLLSALLIMPLTPSYAQCTNNEDGNPGASGEIEYFNATEELYYCDGTDWVLMTNPIIPDDSSTNVNFFIDFFKSALDIFRAALNNQFFVNALNEFRAALANQFFVQKTTIDGDGSGGPTNCKTSGDVCDDGSIYAGLSPDGNIQMYTTPADEGVMPWNNGNGSGTYTDVMTINCTENGPGSTISTCVEGASNTALVTPQDSDSATAGIQPHQAAQACADLVAHGHSDWYLPAMEELWILYDNRVAIGGFSTDFYWSSSEINAFSSRRINFSSGSPSNTNKNLSESVRCVRKELTLPAPIGYWRLDETSGTSALDSSSNGNDGTMTGGLDASNDNITGAENTALNFDGIDDKIDVLGLLGEPTNLTISAWVNLNSADTVGAEVISLGDNAGLRIDDGSFMRGYYYDGTGFPSTVHSITLAGSGWHHVVYTIDSSNNEQNLYLDGISVSSSTHTPAISYAQGSNTLIGTHGNGSAHYDFNGALDDIRVYDTPLTADEITAIYSQGRIPPIGHWKLDETSGTTAADSSGNGHDGTMNDGLDGANDSVNGVISNALDFDGADDGIELPASSTLFPNNNSWTTSAWFKTISPANGTYGNRIFNPMQNATNGSAFILSLDGLDLDFAHDDGTSLTNSSVATINEHTWYHVASSYDGTTFKVYLNGTEELSVTDTFSGFGTGNAAIGEAGDGTAPFPGQIDDVRIYDRVLSASEILELYNDSNSALVGHWKLDETSGTIAVDSSGNGYHGTTSGGLDTTTDNSTGIFETALDFDSGGYIDIGNDPALAITGDITLSAWVNIDSTSNDDAVINYSAIGETLETNTLYVMHVRPSGVLIGHERGLGLNQFFNYSSAVLDYKKWYHLAAVRDDTAKTWKLFVNGSQVESDYNYAISAEGGSSSKLQIGRNAGLGTTIDGRIDDARIYNKALTAAEILELYNKPNEALIGHWKLDETSGTTAADSSGNGNDGTMEAGLDAANDSVDGIYDTSLYFDASGEFINIGDVAIYDFDASDFTLSTWFKTTSNTDQGLISKRDNSSTTENGYGIKTDNGYLRGYIGDGTNGNESHNFQVVNDGKWHHAVMTICLLYTSPSPRDA